MIQQIELPARGKISIEVIGGINNANSYTVAIWNTVSRQWDKIGEGLASTHDPDSDVFPLGDAADLKGHIILVRAFILPYAPDTGPYFVGANITGDGGLSDKLEGEYPDPVTANLIGKFV